MADPNPSSSSSSFSWLPSLRACLLTILILFAAVAFYQPPDFHPVPLPADDYAYSSPSLPVPYRNSHLRSLSDRVGAGLLPGPEDLAYDAEAGYLYTGCSDGWIKRVRLSGDDAGKVENWTYVGGRPLGLAFASDKSLLVTEAHKGLLLVKAPDTIKLLTDEAQGVKFRIIDGVDVASDGIVYFTDASYKYNLELYMLDILEGLPYGRLLSFNPSTNHTDILATDLYFANGVSLSPDDKFVIFCESVMRRCRRFHITGEKRGKIENFIQDLPGFPDNIRYDGEGHYWIGLYAGRTFQWDIMFKYPVLRKVVLFVLKFVPISAFSRDSGVLKVSLDGELLELYYDRYLNLVTGGLKIGDNLYYGSLHEDHLGRINLVKHAAS